MSTDRTNDDDLVAALIGAAGRPPTATPAAIERWRETFETELGIARRRGRWRRAALGAAAIAAVLVAAIAVVIDEPGSTNVAPTAATLARVEGGAYRADGAAILVGEAVRIDDQVSTSPSSRAVLAYRNAEIRLDTSTTVTVRAARIVLESGTLYVDTGRERAAGDMPVVIGTPLATVSHQGTQFLVALRDDRLNVSVREGTLILSTDGSHRQFSAVPGRATTVTIERGRAPVVRDEPAFGSRWAWAAALAGPFSRSERSVAEYVAWLAREHGYRVDYADEAAGRRASRAKIHGDLTTLDPPEQLRALAATARLDIDLVEGVVHVASEGEEEADGRDDG